MSTSKAKPDGAKVGCGHNKRFLPPCTGCTSKKCHVCEGLKKEEADRIHEQGQGYTCRECITGHINEEYGGEVATLMKKLEALENRQKSLEKEVKEEKKLRKALEERLRIQEQSLEEVKCKMKAHEAMAEKEKEGRLQLSQGMDQVRKKVKTLEEEEKSDHERLKETVRKETASFAEKLKENLPTKPGKVVTLKEVTDINERRMNVVFRGIQEPSGEDNEQKHHQDFESLCEVAVRAGVDGDLFRKTVVRVRRLGRQEEGKNFRPLLVRLIAPDVRELLLRGNRALKEANKEDNTRYRIDPDLTREQQQKLNDLWDEARKKNESKNGVKYFVIGRENPELRSRKVEEEEQ